MIGWAYGDCGMAEVERGWEHGAMTLPVILDEAMPGEGCER